MSDVIERANAALDGVTLGPWVHITQEADAYDWQDRVVDAEDWDVCCNKPYYPTAVSRGNARFIAAARQLVPDMRDEITALRARIAELEARRPEATP